MILRDLLRVLGTADRRTGRNLTHDEAFDAFRSILRGDESEIQIGVFLITLRWKGVTTEELTGFARAAREKATIPCSGMKGLVCLCPPHDGYDSFPPLEVAVGLAAAGAGARVMLISDRGVPPRRGLTAASVMEGLGASMTWDPAEAERWVEKTRFAVIAASGMLPPLLGLRRVRGEIGMRTPLSTVEKLIAPATSAVVLGAQSGPVLGTAVETMAGLGHPRGIAIQGIGGGVVPTLQRRSRGIELDRPHIVPVTVEPADFGLKSTVDPDLPMFGPPDEGQGTGDNPYLVRAASEVVERVMNGEAGPARSATVLGAAIALKAVGRSMTLAEGVDLAIGSLDSGAARGVLDRLRAIS
jgi:anthranilate phosphoribosyltransferase